MLVTQKSGDLQDEYVWLVGVPHEGSLSLETVTMVVIVCLSDLAVYDLGREGRQVYWILSMRFAMPLKDDKPSRRDGKV